MLTKRFLLCNMDQSDHQSSLRCVEELLETNISEEQLLRAADLLTSSQYNDVVDERNIEQLCGYPLCDHTLENVPKQRYHISTATNQVFDLTQRKKFCSSHCFKSSNYLSSQISSLPPKARTTHRSVHLLSSSLCQSVTENTPQTPLLNTTPPTHTSPTHTPPTHSPPTHSPPTHTPPTHTSPTHTPPTHSPPTHTPPTHSPPTHTPPTHSPPTHSPPTHTPPTHSPSTHTPTTHSPPTHTPPTHSPPTHTPPIRQAPRSSSLPPQSNTNPSVQRLADCLDIWMGSPDEFNSAPSEVLFPPLHDVCISQVQRSLFISQLRNAMRSMSGVNSDDIVRMTASFRLTNQCVTFRPPQWCLLVLLLNALCHGDSSVDHDLLDKSLDEIKGTQEDFTFLLNRARRLLGRRLSD